MSIQNKKRLSPAFESLYPYLNISGYEVTSKKDKKYNCVGWAAKRDKKWWWEPLKEPGCYWPKGVPFDHALQNYIKVFEKLGYRASVDMSLESGFEKVAIYKDSYGEFTHVSHQLKDGRWTSKLGPDEDVEHASPMALETDGSDEAYGSIAQVMKRKRRIWDKPNLNPKSFWNPLRILKKLLNKFSPIPSSNRISN